MITTAKYAKPRQTRRPKRPSYDAMEDMAKELSDVLYYRGVELSQAWGDHPVDTEKLPDMEQWEILEVVAQTLSPWTWGEPGALRDLYHFRQKFAPETATEDLLIAARAADKIKLMTPDVDVTPADPRFKQQASRLGLKVA